MTKIGNQHASNPVNPMFRGDFKSEIRPNALDSLRGNTVARIQTVFTSSEILDPICELFGCRPLFDPVHAEGSLVNPAEFVLVPWEKIWTRCHELAAQSDGFDAVELIALVRSEVKGKDASSPAAAKRAKEIRDALRFEFEEFSGHFIPWRPKTFINPPYGCRGPETILADFRMFCAAFARAEHETVMLAPFRAQRKWLRRDLIEGADCVTYLNSVKFVGWKQNFPAPLLLAYKVGRENSGRRVERIKLAAQCFKALGDTYTSSKVKSA